MVVGRGPGAMAVAAVLAVAAGCSTEEQPAPVTTTDSAGRTVVTTPDPDEQPDAATAIADPVPTTLPVPDADGTDRTQPPSEQAVLVRVSVDVPGGWTVQDMGDAVPDTPQPGLVAPQQWCLVPPEPAPEVDGCGGVIVAVGGDWLPGAGGEPYAPGQENGWLATQGPLLCPFDPDATLDEDGEGNVVVPEAEGAPLTSDEAEVGGLATRYETWRVRCAETDDALTPRVWYVPELNVLVKDVFGWPETVPLLETLDGA